ncbi:MAG TPA: CHAP domain-containing protein [Candidatus Saccharimonadales bacterium]|nr:CHAP domain-containing protein [Candidatus Saccharimonadales bacterium]
MYGPVGRLYDHLRMPMSNIAPHLVKIARIAAICLLAASGIAAVFTTKEAVETPQAFAAGAMVPGSLNYPWKDAPCEFSNGGSSCINPHDASDKYGWYIDENSDGVFTGSDCGSSTPSGECFDERGYQYRNCTSYVAWKLHSLGVPNSQLSGLKNGGDWYRNVPASRRATAPKAGAVAVAPRSSTSTLGHVAFVEAVNADGTITVSEYNHDTKGYGDMRAAAPAALGFTEYIDFGVSADKQAARAAATLARPAAVLFRRDLNVFVRGDDGQVYTQYWDGTRWSGFSSIGGNTVNDPAVIVNGSALNVFALNRDGQIYTAYNDGGGWSGWASLGSQVMRGNPKAVQYGNELDVFATGVNGHPYKNTWQPATGWGGWSSLGNYMDSSPAPVVYNGELDVVMRGTNNMMYKDTWTGGSWGGFGEIGSCCLAGNPAALSYGSQLDVWSGAPDNHVYKLTWNGSAWSGWVDAGGGMAGNPDVVQYGLDLNVFMRGTNGQIYHRYWSTGSQNWSGWASIDATKIVAGDPTAIQYGSELDIFVTGTDGKTYKNTRQQNGSWGGFSLLSG